MLGIYSFDRVWKEVDQRLEDHETRRVAGVDVSYRNHLYISVLTLFLDGKFDRIVKDSGISNEPYRTSLFFLKEAPIISQLIYREPIDLLFVNGHGICHPYRFGLATVIGLTHRIPTIGIAKRLIAGVYGETASMYPDMRFITGDDRILGIAIGNTKSKRPVIVSQGFGISLERTIREYLRWTKNGKMPEPLRLAHIHGKSVRKNREGNT